MAGWEFVCQPRLTHHEPPKTLQRSPATKCQEFAWLSRRLTILDTISYINPASCTQCVTPSSTKGHVHSVCFFHKPFVFISVHKPLLPVFCFCSHLGRTTLPCVLLLCKSTWHLLPARSYKSDSCSLSCWQKEAFAALPTKGRVARLAALLLMVGPACASCSPTTPLSHVGREAGLQRLARLCGPCSITRLEPSFFFLQKL